MTDDIIRENVERRELKLLGKRREILAQPPEVALEMILNAPLQAELIQSFPEQDFYFLVHDIGITDAVPILSMATSEQWGFMLDVEVWNRDRLDIDAVTYWFQILLLSDPKRLVHWLLVERLEFLELYLFKNIEVMIREENQDPSEMPDGSFTVDDTFYVRIKKKPVIPSDDGRTEWVSQDDLDAVVKDVIEILIDINHSLYQSIMLEAMGVIPAEAEEDDLRFRNSRLAEKGFLPFEEAMDVYSPLTLEQICNRRIRRDGIQVGVTGSLVPMSHMGEIREQNRFTEALALLDSTVDMTVLEMEFASLCNQVISADQKPIREKEGLSGIVRKVGSFVSIGIEIVEASDGKDDLNPAIMNYSLKDLHRLGIGRVTDLKWRAQRLKRDGWFSLRKLPLGFWGETFLGVIGGVLIKRPLYFDNFAGGTLYRDFKTLGDILKTEKDLEDVRGFDELFSMMNISLERFKGYFLTYQNLILTLWFQDICGRPDSEDGPVSMDDFKTCFNGLWDSGTNVGGEPKKIRGSQKTLALSWLSRRSGFTDVEISERLGGALETLFTEIEKDYGAVATENLDPRFLPHFCIYEGKR